MDEKKQKKVAYTLLVILFVVGVVCYAAFPYRAPEEPVRILFKSTAGNVLFDHKQHASEEGYGFACTDCHHDLEEQGQKPTACTECHTAKSKVTKEDAFHAQCRACHEEGGSGPVKCSACHAL
ncbi:MAG: cytochrome c3 family protein [Deltaproteobacteria bacterium]|nr:cytochrome c3 family protein [Deltaproteobacteria bacterium]MBW1918725.1 cytochrome c3 family protein [Deltaproteobacteria bacterium]MBW1934512.1 cytochrome c3 family protein [Deltaproteobacteria bacterium]MBW1977108.1 cytochrome c3 family protein [Deltaproteobacteria bacterium]MBW2045499.1 cytochrome c3 family protein [Deltaproteobacteria bacterium]